MTSKAAGALSSGAGTGVGVGIAMGAIGAGSTVFTGVDETGDVGAGVGVGEGTVAACSGLGSCTGASHDTDPTDPDLLFLRKAEATRNLMPLNTGLFEPGCGELEREPGRDGVLARDMVRKLEGW